MWYMKQQKNEIYVFIFNNFIIINPFGWFTRIHWFNFKVHLIYFKIETLEIFEFSEDFQMQEQFLNPLKYKIQYTPLKFMCSVCVQLVAALLVQI